jgi:hypothetical protein
VDQHRLPDEPVALADYKGRSLYGALWLQPVAVSRKSSGLKNRRNTRKPLPWVASGCLRSSMVRRGVDGSSPSEGFPIVPANRHFVVVSP